MSLSSTSLGSVAPASALGTRAAYTGPTVSWATAAQDRITTLAGPDQQGTLAGGDAQRTLARQD